MALQQNPLQSLRVDVDFFHCCAGTGQRLLDDRLYVCKLQRRKAKLQVLINKFKSLWGDGYDKFWQRKLQAVDIAKLHACAEKEHHCRGRMLVSTQARRSPSYLWLVAAAGIWRFGLQVHFVSLISKSNDNLIPVQSQNKAGSQDNMAVMVENHLATVHPENIIDCETIVNYCYNTNTPLWIDFAGEANKTNKKFSSLNFQVREKLQLLQNKHPLTHFGHSGRSKLLEIT